ncbi:MAG: hypothetical protein QGH39_11220 [Candidatus Thermoplasmatota archaeon]|nr:hypothetical protein [Candidatus Thermoplasmatota archaeon]MDP7266114.1 hypothetical protein [Candidatus Thermoplasmatota archaeon]
MNTLMMLIGRDRPRKNRTHKPEICKEAGHEMQYLRTFILEEPGELNTPPAICRATTPRAYLPWTVVKMLPRRDQVLSIK